MNKYILVLGLALLVVLSGCISPDASVSFENVSESEVAERATTNSGSINDEVSEAIENGTVTTVQQLPFDIREDVEAVVHEGSVYDLDQNKTGESTETRVVVVVEKTNKSSDFSIGSLSDKDREIISGAVDAVRSMDNVEREIYFPGFYTDNELRNSVFTEQDGIKVGFGDERNYKLTVVEREEVDRDLYKYSSEQISPTIEDYGEELIEEHAFALENISKETESLVEESISQGYYGEESDAYNRLNERFRQENAVREADYSGEWIAYYEGELYWVKIST